jgi:hypothetical protein
MRNVLNVKKRPIHKNPQPVANRAELCENELQSSSNANANVEAPQKML